MKRFNVLSTFAANNPAFSTPGEAIEYAQAQRGRGQLVIPDSDVLIVDGFHFDVGFEVLRIGFANGHELVFRVLAETLAAEYEVRLEAGPAGRAYGSVEEEVSLYFCNGLKSSCTWSPARVLGPLVGQELIDFDERKNQFYLYFSNICLSLSTLRNADTGSLLLFWTEAV